MNRGCHATFFLSFFSRKILSPPIGQKNPRLKQRTGDERVASIVSSPPCKGIGSSAADSPFGRIKEGNGLHTTVLQSPFALYTFPLDVKGREEKAVTEKVRGANFSPSFELSRQKRGHGRKLLVRI